GIIICAKIGGIADEHIDEFAAEFEACVRDMVTGIGLQDGQARPAKKNRPAKQIRKVGIGAARSGAWRVVNGRNAIKAWQEGRLIAEAESIAQIVAELAEVPHGGTGKRKRLKAGDAAFIADWEKRHSVGIRAQTKIAAKIFQGLADLKLIV